MKGLSLILVLVVISALLQAENLSPAEFDPPQASTHQDCDYYTLEVPTYDTITLKGTVYNPEPGQTDSTPFRTGDGSTIPPDRINEVRWVALSQDLLWFNGGPFRYGDTINLIYSGPYEEKVAGKWTVRDAMNKKWSKKVDLLTTRDYLYARFKNIKVVIETHRTKEAIDHGT